MNNTEKKEKKNSQSQTIDGDSNAEYIYIIEDQEVWFIDYIIGIAFMSVSVAPSVLILTVPLAGSGSTGFIEMSTPSGVPGGSFTRG